MRDRNAKNSQQIVLIKHQESILQTYHHFDVGWQVADDSTKLAFLFSLGRIAVMLSASASRNLKDVELMGQALREIH